MFIHSSKALKVSKTYSSHLDQLGRVCDYCLLGFHSPKKIPTHLLTAHDLPVMRAVSADLDTTSAVADAALGDVRAADGDKINGTKLQKNESAFLVFLRHT